MLKSKQKQIYRQLLLEADEKDVVDRIDFSSLESYSSDEIPLNYSEKVHISHRLEEYFYDPKLDALLPRFVDDNIQQGRPNYKNLAGQKVTPTRIISLLTQNPGSVTKNNSYEGHGFAGSTRPASQLYWSRQPDEGYYVKAAKRNLASFLAETEPNYYVVEENSPHRLKFKCPNAPKGMALTKDDLCDTWIPGLYRTRDDLRVSWVPWIVNEEFPKPIGDLTIYIDPDNDRARWACPKCTAKAADEHISIEESKVLGYRHQTSHTFAIFHDIPRPLRIELADDGIIPGKKYVYKDRKSESGDLLRYITQHSGLCFNELDKAMDWPHGTSERILNTQLKDKVRIVKGRRGYKGYKVYIKH